MDRRGTVWVGLAATGLLVVLLAWWFLREDDAGRVALPGVSVIADQPASGPAGPPVAETGAGRVAREEQPVLAPTGRRGDGDEEGAPELQAVRVSGRVRCQGRPVQDAEVVLSQVDVVDQVRTLGTLRSDEEGAFATTVQLVVDGPWLRDLHFVARAAGLAPTEDFEYVGVDDEEVTFDIDLEPGGEILGRVVDATGAPVAGAEVTLLTGVVNLCPSVDTDPDGTFRFAFTQEGEMKVRARMADRGAAAGAPFQTRNGDRIVLPDLVLDGAGELGGSLGNASGEPMAHARIELVATTLIDQLGWTAGAWPDSWGGLNSYDENGIRSASLDTDAGGGFRVSGLAPGWFELRIRGGRPEYWTAHTGQTSLELMQFRPALEVTVQDQEDPDGAVTGVARLFRAADPEQVQAWSFLEEGRARLSVQDGMTFSLLVVANKQGRVARHVQSVRIPADQELTQVSVPLVLRRPGLLRIRTAERGVTGQVRVRAMDPELHQELWFRTLLPSGEAEAPTPPGAVEVHAVAQVVHELETLLRAPEPLPVQDVALPSTWRILAPDPVTSAHVEPGETSDLVLGMRPGGAVLLVLIDADRTAPGEEARRPRSLGRSWLADAPGPASRENLFQRIRAEDPSGPAYYVSQYALAPGTHRWRGESWDGRAVEGSFTVSAGVLTVVHASWGND